MKLTKKLFTAGAALILAFVQGTFTFADDFSDDNFIKAFLEKEKKSEASLPDDFNDTDFVTFKGTGSQDIISYTIGENTQSFKTKRYLKPFKLNKYETTYSLWYRIRIQAEKMGYSFANPGQEGSGGRRGKAPTESKRYEPVTMINWYDTIVWLNAYSEISGKTPCYTYEGQILRDSSDTAPCDLCECNWKADGYRLPTEAEWEYAARYSPEGMQRGDTISGQTDDKETAWFSNNTSATKTAGTAGGSFSDNSIVLPGTGNANSAGIFDMSGNVLEYCWDWESNYTDVSFNTVYYGPEYGSTRISRGGSWSPYTPYLYAGDRYSYDPNEAYNYMGFRIASN